MNPSDQPTDHSDSSRKPQAGQQGGQQPPAATPEAPSLPPAAPSQAPASAPQSEPAQQNWFRSDEQAPEAPGQPFPADIRMQGNGQEVSWTASEFVEHEKSPAWYLAMVGASVALMGLVFLITRDWFNTIVVAVAAILFGVVAGRQPRHMQYVINDRGISIGRRFYGYGDFRSFSLVDEGVARSIVLMPLKRFMPPLNLYYDPADEVRIGDLLASHLPMAEHQHELIDRLMHRIRF